MSNNAFNLNLNISTAVNLEIQLINCKLHIEFNINKLNLLQDKIYYQFRKKNILKKIKKKFLANLIILKFNICTEINICAFCTSDCVCHGPKSCRYSLCIIRTCSNQCFYFANDNFV